MSLDQQPHLFRRESLERLSSPEQLDQLMQIVTPKSWLPLTACGSIFLLAILWGIFGRIPMTATGTGVLVHPTESSDELVGLTYFSREVAEEIRPGMELLLIPDRMSRDRMGGIRAQVKEMAKPPVTTLDAARQAQAAAEASVLQDGRVEVLAELERDPSTVSGYQWSSSSGSQVPLSPGMALTARITLKQKAPITLVFPFLEAAP